MAPVMKVADVEHTHRFLLVVRMRKKRSFRLQVPAKSVTEQLVRYADKRRMRMKPWSRWRKKKRLLNVCWCIEGEQEAAEVFRFTRAEVLGKRKIPWQRYTVASSGCRKVEFLFARFIHVFRLPNAMVCNISHLFICLVLFVSFFPFSLFLGVYVV